MPDHTVYWLKAGKKNYIGYTSNLQHRLRQHNGELQGERDAQRAACGMCTRR